MGRTAKAHTERVAELKRVIVQAVRAGERMADVAKIFGYSTSAVYQACREAGLSGKLTPAIHELVTRENLEKLVTISGNGCWEWPGSRNDSSYSRIGSFAGHRLAYEIFNGPIADGLYVLHRCDNPPCVNPAHLFLGTHVENMHDCTAKGRRARGETAGTHKLNPEAVQLIRKMRIKGGFTLREIGKRFGISGESVRQIVGGVTWKHLVEPGVEPEESAVSAA